MEIVFFIRFSDIGGYLTWQDLPNKSYSDLNSEELKLYNQVLSHIRVITRDYMREFIGDSTFELDPNMQNISLLYKKPLTKSYILIQNDMFF